MMPNGAAGINLGEGIPTEVERIGKQFERITGQLHGNLWEMASRGQLFFAASQAATTWSVALHTTHTGLCLSNPAGSTVNLEIHRVGFAFSVAPAAETTIALAVGYLAAGVATHTTPLVVYNCKVGTSASAAQAKADAAATLVGTPLNYQMLISGGAAAAEVPGNAYFNIDGGLCIPPGAYAFISSLSVAVGEASIAWSEWPA
jgi:hypothetical protein